MPRAGSTDAGERPATVTSRDCSPARATRLVLQGVRLQGTGDRLDEGSKAVLDYAARFIKENPRAAVYLGSYFGNRELTYRRERAAAAYPDIKRTRPIA
jgi:hypothetical protein